MRRRRAPRPTTRRVVDEGLQVERSALAWDRTALTVAVNGALLARAGGIELTWARGAAVVVLTVAVTGLLFGRSRYLRHDAAMRGTGRRPGDAIMVAAGTTAVGVSLVVLAVVVHLAVV